MVGAGKASFERLTPVAVGEAGEGVRSSLTPRPCPRGRIRGRRLAATAAGAHGKGSAVCHFQKSRFETRLIKYRSEAHLVKLLEPSGNL